MFHFLLRSCYYSYPLLPLLIFFLCLLLPLLLLFLCLLLPLLLLFVSASSSSTIIRDCFFLFYYYSCLLFPLLLFFLCLCILYEIHTPCTGSPFPIVHTRWWWSFFFFIIVRRLVRTALNLLYNNNSLIPLHPTSIISIISRFVVLLYSYSIINLPRQPDPARQRPHIL